MVTLWHLTADKCKGVSEPGGTQGYGGKEHLHCLSLQSGLILGWSWDCETPDEADERKSGKVGTLATPLASHSVKHEQLFIIPARMQKDTAVFGDWDELILLLLSCSGTGLLGCPGPLRTALGLCIFGKWPSSVLPRAAKMICFAMTCG